METEEQLEKELVEMFENASNFVKTVATTLKAEDLLYLYSRYKQVIGGPCNISRPGLFDFQGKQKWDAWKKLGNMSKTDAMVEYVNKLASIDPEWEEKIETGKVKPKSGMGVGVSTMCSAEDFISDEEKSVFDWCQEGSVEKVTQLLISTPDINALDQNGLALIHWACDRGYKDLVDILLNHGASVNLQDQDGQTPLHYATSCEHLAVIQLLLSRNANVDLKDFGGTSVIESTNNADIISVLHEASRQTVIPGRNL